jgi:hypothetical protein
MSDRTGAPPPPGLPGSDLPGPGLSRPELPGPGLPGSDLPSSGLPGSGLPGSDLPSSGLPGSGLPGSDLPSSGLPGSGLPGPVPPSAFPGAVPPVPPPGPDGQWRPARVDPVPGTEYGLVRLDVPPVTSGLATGALIAGIASILVSTLVLCFGTVGSGESWGGWVAGAFALLAVLSGGGAVALGLVATRQIRRSGVEGRLRFTGRGVAVAGISCGAAGAGIALLSLALSLVLQFS